MFDPAAMGTLLIGLGAADSDGRDRQPRRAVAASRPPAIRVRLALAATLRRAASALERPEAREIAG